MTVLEVMIVVMFVVWGGRRLQMYPASGSLWDRLKVPIIQINEVAEREAQVQSAKGKGQSQNAERQVQSPKSKVQSQNAGGIAELSVENYTNRQIHFQASAATAEAPATAGDEAAVRQDTFTPPTAGAERRTGRGQGVGALGVQLFSYKWLIALFLFAATIAVFVSDDRVAALGIWKAYFIEPVLFFIVLTQVFAPTRKSGDQHLSTVLSSTSINFYQLFTALGLSGLFVAIPAIVQKFTAWGIANPFWAAEETRRVVSWYGFPNAVGLYLAPVVILSAGLLVAWMTGRKQADESFAAEGRRKILRLYVFGVVVVFSAVAIIFARSEGAMVGMAVGLVALIFGLAGGRARWGMGLICLIGLMGLMIATPARSLMLEKATFSDLSGQIRLQQWRETWNMLKDDRLIFGAGLANYQTAIRPYHQEGIFFNFDNDPNFRNNLVFGGADYKAKHWQPTEIYLYPHNFFLNFWSETGLLGLVAILLILIKFFTDYLRTDEARRPLYLILISVMIAIVVHGLVDVQYFKNDLSVLFWLVVGMGAVVKGQKNS